MQLFSIAFFKLYNLVLFQTSKKYCSLPVFVCHYVQTTVPYALIRTHAIVSYNKNYKQEKIHEWDELEGRPFVKRKFSFLGMKSRGLKKLLDYSVKVRSWPFNTTVLYIKHVQNP